MYSFGWLREAGWCGVVARKAAIDSEDLFGETKGMMW